MKLNRNQQRLLTRLRKGERLGIVSEHPDIAALIEAKMIIVEREMFSFEYGNETIPVLVARLNDQSASPASR